MLRLDIVFQVYYCQLQLWLECAVCDMQSSLLISLSKLWLTIQSWKIAWRAKRMSARQRSNSMHTSTALRPLSSGREFPVSSQGWTVQTTLFIMYPNLWIIFSVAICEIIGNSRTCISFVFNFQCCWSHPWLENAPILCSQYRLWHAFGVENKLCGKTTRKYVLILFHSKWKFDPWPQYWSFGIMCSKVNSWSWSLCYIFICSILCGMINMATLLHCSRTRPGYSTTVLQWNRNAKKYIFLLQHVLLKCVLW